MRKLDAPIFPGINAPSTDFDAVKDGRRARVLYYDVDLSTARSIAAGTALILNIAANSFFSDQSSSQGNATLYFQDFTLNPTDAPPIFVGPGFVASIPFTTLLIENTAQAGKRLRFFYGIDVDFKPSLSGSLTIGGTVNATPYGYSYSASYKTTTNMAGLAADIVFSPGANLNGAILWRATFFHMNAGGNGAGFIAKSSVPATIIDGDVICGVDSYAATAANNFNLGRLEAPVLIPAGRGLYYMPQNADVQAYRSALYTLL